jgi:hypothetical protein
MSLSPQVVQALDLGPSHCKDALYSLQGHAARWL